VIVEIPEAGRDHDLPDGDVTQPGVDHQLRERPRLAHQKAATFVPVGRFRIELDGRVPEVAHELDLAGIVPDIEGDDSAGVGDPPHLPQRSGSIGNRVQHEP
jgi:hypothetical protein